MSEGYIKLYKKMRDWGWYRDHATKDVFLELLLTAAWSEGEYRGVKISPGDCVIGRKELSERLGLSEQNVRTALAHLKNTGEITTRATNKFTVVTIANWASYQGGGGTTNQQANQQITSNQPTTNQQLTTYKESKNIRIQEDIHSELLPYDEIVEAWNRICVSLPRVKKLTDVRKRMIRTRLKHNDLGDILTAMKAVEESDFLSGRSGEWRASFDWLMNSDSNIIKVLEGNYENRQKVSKTQNEFEAARRRIMEQYERVTQFG